MKLIENIIDKVAEKYPYKVKGDRSTYSSYNEAWSDACDQVSADLEGIESIIIDKCINRIKSLIISKCRDQMPSKGACGGGGLYYKEDVLPDPETVILALENLKKIFKI